MPRLSSIRTTAVCIDASGGYHACVGPQQLNVYVKEVAESVGFDACGIARAEPIGRADYLRAWINAGKAGSMEYLHRHFGKRSNPQLLLDGAKTVIVVALMYEQPPPPIPPKKSTTGRIAKYAWGDDYHPIVKSKLHEMADRMRADLDERFDSKACVDTAPLVEREVAASAGIGWIAKNTLVLDARLGSYFFLGELVTTLEVAPDAPAVDHCGSCTACLDACPTEALIAPYQMDASRCISYLTIEHRGDISRPFQEKLGDWIFGCDECQAVCPHNSSVPVTRAPGLALRPPAPAPRLEELLTWSVEEYRTQLKRSAIRRATLDMLKRNARIALRSGAGSGPPS